MKLNKVILIFAMMIFSSQIFADISSGAKSLIDNFFELRMNLSKNDYETSEGRNLIIGQIENFKADNSAQLELLNEEENLVLENFFIMEVYNYLYKLPGQDKIQHEILGKQLEKLENFSKKNKENLSAYFYCTMADVTSCFMGYSVSDVLKYGTKVKPLYEKALEKTPDLSYALTNIGQWYYFAPKITGGSKKKALNFFEKALQNAKTNAEKYFADIFLSQLLFENEEFVRAEELVNEAESFCPESFYIKTIKTANKNGISLYEYNKKNSALNEEYEKK